jgi:hypothetical protein
VRPAARDPPTSRWADDLPFGRVRRVRRARTRHKRREEVTELTIDADDADNLQDLLASAWIVFFDVRRRTLMFGTAPFGNA